VTPIKIDVINIYIRMASTCMANLQAMESQEAVEDTNDLRYIVEREEQIQALMDQYRHQHFARLSQNYGISGSDNEATTTAPATESGTALRSEESGTGEHMIAGGKQTKEAIASHTYNNFDISSIDDVSQLLSILKDCVTETQMKREILEFELRNYKEEPQTTMTLEEFTNAATKVFQRYQWKAGGYYIEFMTTRYSSKTQYQRLMSILMTQHIILKTSLLD